MNMILLQKFFKGVLKKVVTSHEYENTNRFITFWFSKITLNSNPCLQRTHHTYEGNYCVLPEYHKCVLPPLTLMVDPTN